MTPQPQRSFEPGDPALPDNGLIVGRGGGFTHVYEGYVLYADNGKIEKIKYTMAGGATPSDYEVIAVGSVDVETVTELDAKLTASGFWNSKPEGVTASVFEYVVANNSKKGTNFVLWVMDSDHADDEKILGSSR